MDYNKLKVINDLLLNIKKAKYDVEELDVNNYDDIELKHIGLLAHGLIEIEEVIYSYKKHIMN